MNDERDNYIDWMHPSWRDLVIDHLAKNDDARRQFLAKCSSTGFLLALSTAGGAKGERQRPLLLHPEDWKALQSSVSRVHASGTYSQNIILTAIINVRQNSLLDRSHVLELHELATLVLADLHSLWGREHTSFNASLLEKYFAVSEELSPIPPAPYLGTSWEESWNEAKSEFRLFDPDSSECEFTSIDEWTHLTAVIQRNEPRFLRQVCFPSDFDGIVETFLEHVEQHMDTSFTFDSSEELSYEEGRLDTLDTILNRLTRLFPSLSSRASSLAKIVARRKSDHEESRTELEEKERAQSSSKLRGNDSSHPDEGEISFIGETLDVGKLFDDL